MMQILLTLRGAFTLLIGSIAMAATESASRAADIIARIGSRNPSVDFLTDTVAVESALLALAIPLSFEIVSRISERYESDVIAKRFVKEPIVRLMPYWLMFNICLVIAIEFFRGPGEHTGTRWKIVAWVGLMAFVATAGLFFWFLDTLKNYVVNRKSVIKRLLDDARKSLG